MALFKDVIEAFVASRELDQGTLSRLAFWCDALGEKEVAAITTDDMDAALVKLAARTPQGRQAPDDGHRQTHRGFSAQSCARRP